MTNKFELKLSKSALEWDLSFKITYLREHISTHAVTMVALNQYNCIIICSRMPSYQKMLKLTDPF